MDHARAPAPGPRLDQTATADPDLARILAALPELRPTIRRAIQALSESVAPSGQSP